MNKDHNNPPNLPRLHDDPAPTYQTDFSPGSGNALQACVAALFHVPMEDTPNFVTLHSYEQGIQDFVATFGYTAVKRKLSDTAISDNNNNRTSQQTSCILRGKSPRGDFGHVIVARCRETGGFDFVWDPHPNSTFLDESEPYGWYMTFEKIDKLQ
eukprot:scaffold2102_cov161-Amphora_coffeaeformis.AAC.29